MKQLDLLAIPNQPAPREIAIKSKTIRAYVKENLRGFARRQAERERLRSERYKREKGVQRQMTVLGKRAYEAFHNNAGHIVYPAYETIPTNEQCGWEEMSWSLYRGDLGVFANLDCPECSRKRRAKMAHNAKKRKV